MIETNSDAGEFSPVNKGREFLQRGDVRAAVECYGQAYDPDALDEAEARNMLIEARSHLSKKHLVEALESFEEALLMGTDVQRRQALEGIATIGEIRSQLAALTPRLKKRLKSIFGRKVPPEKGMAFISEDENLVLVSDEAFENIPVRLVTTKRITKVPLHITDYQLPFPATRCIPFTDEDDVEYILEVARALEEVR